MHFNREPLNALKKIVLIGKHVFRYFMQEPEYKIMNPKIILRIDYNNKEKNHYF